MKDYPVAHEVPKNSNFGFRRDYLPKISQKDLEVRLADKGPGSLARLLEEVRSTGCPQFGNLSQATTPGLCQKEAQSIRSAREQLLLQLVELLSSTRFIRVEEEKTFLVGVPRRKQFGWDWDENPAPLLLIKGGKPQLNWGWS